MEENLKFLLSASGFELERVKTALSDNGIPNDSKPQKRNYSAKAVTGVDISEQDIFVAEKDFEKAYDLCVGIGAIKTGEAVEIIEDSAEEQPPGQAHRCAHYLGNTAGAGVCLGDFLHGFCHRMDKKSIYVTHGA